MAGNVFKLLSDLAAKEAPQVIYKYRLKPLYRAGALSLSAVLLAYSLTFADVSKLSASIQYKGADEEEQKDALFLIKAYGPIAMAVLPLGISFGSLYVLSRTVTKVRYIPQVNGLPKCELTRTSAILGRDITISKPISQITRSTNVRIYTGKGPQGLDDKASFSFYLKDRSPEVRTPLGRLYILPRSGEVWQSDGRVLSALFGGDKQGKNALFSEGDSAQGSGAVDPAAGINPAQKSAILQEMRKLNDSSRVKFHRKGQAMSQSDIVKNIVNNTKK